MSSAALAPARPIAAPRAGGAGRWLLALIALLVATAAFPGLRIEAGGLQVPPHVIPLLVAMPLALGRLRRIPSNVRVTLFAFTGLFAVSVLRYGSEFGDLVKMITSVMTLVAVAALVRTKRDFVYGAVAFSAAIIVINFRGLTGGITANVGYEPLRGIANKNAYSIYALPAVMVAGYLLLHFRHSKLVMILLSGAILSSTFILFTGANRSGWGGIVLIGAMLAAQARRWRALGGVGALAAVSYAVFALFGTSEIFDYRLEQTTSGYQSDDVRQSLFSAALEVGIENPVLGVGPQLLPRELAKRLLSDADVVDPHNFIGYIVGGCGLFTLVALLALGRALWRRPIPNLHPNLRLAHDLVRMLLVLFVFRGFFSREVFSVASFPIALGLALGLALVDEPDGWELTTDR